MINNREAEQAVIGTILYEPTLFDSLIVEPEHFYTTSLKIAFKAMHSLAKKNRVIDLVTLADELDEDIDKVGGISYLTDLAQSIPTTANLKHHEHLVLESYRERKSRELALKYAENPSDPNIENLIKELESIQEVGATTDEQTTYEVLQEIADDILSPEKHEEGYKTGFTDLDKILGGVQKGDLVIIAARPSVGKTAFALNIGNGHCANGGTTHLFSLEMSTKKLLQRMISAEGNVDGQKWRTMSFSRIDYDNAFQAIDTLTEHDLHIHDDKNTLNQIKSTIRQSITGKDLVIIDYLGLIRTSGRYERRDLEVGAITRELKLLATELNIPIILLSQLSRGVEQRQDKRPMMSDLRESGNVEQDADVIGFLYRDDYYDSESEKQNIIEIIISKQRNGPVGTVELAFLKEYGKFMNLDRRYLSG